MRSTSAAHPGKTKKVKSRDFFRLTRRLGLIQLQLLFILQTAFAGSATWQLNPVSGDWNTAANWTPPTIPNGSADTATFDVSNQTNLTLSANTEVNGIVFNVGASAFTAALSGGLTLTLSGTGITNNSGVTQNFIATEGAIVFNNSSVAGASTSFVVGSSGTVSFNNFSQPPTSVFTINGSGQVTFSGFGKAGTSTYTFNGSVDATPALLQFSDNSSAFQSTFTLNGDGAGVDCTFLNSSQGSFGTFIINGADSPDHGGGIVSFHDNSTANFTTLIANGGLNGGDGGMIFFSDASSIAGGALVEVHGNARLDISGHTSFYVTITSVEGDGSVFLGGQNLIISSDANSTFSGQIHDGGASGGTGGVLTKKGRGTLTLIGANTYTGGTVVSAINPNRKGTLAVSNAAGSGTGTGTVSVNLGTLGGSGTIAGAVTIGTGSGSSQVGFLAPAAGGRKPATLTIQSLLTFKGNGAYDYTLQANGNRARADRVNARGVTIESGTQFVLLADQVQGTLPIGTSFVVINNTAATAINGTFANLADGAIVNVNGNNLQASYEGGDGNDLTLTVVP